MKIRKAAAHELLELWGYESIHTASSNAKFFCDNIKRGNTEFWTLDYDGELIGELYVFYDLEDKDFADGKKTHIFVLLESEQISVVRDWGRS